jgi:Carbohydrate esterase, sialic acid-specific acetylesterase
MRVAGIVFGLVFFLICGQTMARPFPGGMALASSVSGLTEFAPDRIFQRVGTANTLYFGGSYSGNPSTVSVQVVDATTGAVLVPWATIQSNPSGGEFSGTLSVPQYDGWMRWQVRLDGVSASITTSQRRFGVGALILLTGQSNMAGLWARSSGSPPTPTTNARRYAGNGWLAIDASTIAGEINDGFNTGRGADGISELANRLHTLLGVNIGLLEYAVGSTSSAQWAQGGSMYLQMTGPGSSAPFGITHADVGSDIEVIFHYQGEYDTINATSSATWQSNTGSYYSGVKSLTRTSLPLGIELLGWAISFPGTSDASWSLIKGAQLSFVANNGPSVFVAASPADGTLTTPTPYIHFDGASYKRFARRLAQSYAFYLDSATYGGAGPVISSVTWASGTPAVLTVNVTPSPGASLKEGAGGSGASVNSFRVFNGATPLTISSVAISGNAVVLTLSANIAQADVTAGSIKVDYEYGESPHGATTPPNLANFVFDDAAPVGDTLGLPLRPTNGQMTVTQ